MRINNTIEFLHNEPASAMATGEFHFYLQSKVFFSSTDIQENYITLLASRKTRYAIVLTPGSDSEFSAFQTFQTSRTRCPSSFGAISELRRSYYSEFFIKYGLGSVVFSPRDILKHFLILHGDGTGTLVF